MPPLQTPVMYPSQSMSQFEHGSPSFIGYLPFGRRTSALESNIGLNAIAHWCATFNNPLPQGLGTGMLFTDNIEVPLEIRKDCLWFCK